MRGEGNGGKWVGHWGRGKVTGKSGEGPGRRGRSEGRSGKVGWVFGEGPKIWPGASPVIGVCSEAKRKQTLPFCCDVFVSGAKRIETLPFGRDSVVLGANDEQTLRFRCEALCK